MSKAVDIAIEEGLFRDMLGEKDRSDRSENYDNRGEDEPMDIDHYRRKKSRCFKCGRVGHRAKECRSAPHRHNINAINKEIRCWQCNKVGPMDFGEASQNSWYGLFGSG